MSAAATEPPAPGRMREQIRRYAGAFAAIIVLIVIAAAVGGYIVAQERLTLPGWVPIFGRSFFTLKGEFQTAQAVTPGQGQTVTIAGVKIGDISSVSLVNGRAVVTMNIQPRYDRIYGNATMLLRPKTGLKDETVELNPGTPAAPRLHSGATLPVSQTAPDVNLDEFLASLDADTRLYLNALIGGAGTGLGGQGRTLSADFRRFEPTARGFAQVNGLLSRRSRLLARVFHNFQLLSTALGGKDNQLAGLVRSSNVVFASLAREQQSIRAALALLPGALHATRTGLGKLATTASVLGPAFGKLLPSAQAFAPGQQASQQLFRATKPIIANQLTPLARTALPTLTALTPAAQDLAAASPNLSSSFATLNQAFNELAYNPGASRGGFLFFLGWLSHDGASLFSTQDATGPIRHGLVYFSCVPASLLKGVAELPSGAVKNSSVFVLLSLINAPLARCPGVGPL